MRLAQTEADVEGRKEEIAQSLFDHIPVGVGSQGIIPTTAADLEASLEMGMDWSLREVSPDPPHMSRAAPGRKRRQTALSGQRCSERHPTCLLSDLQYLHPACWSPCKQAEGAPMRRAMPGQRTRSTARSTGAC